MSRIVYSPRYDIGFFGLERLHPFDARKFSRAWESLQQSLGAALEPLHVLPAGPIPKARLERVHAPAYLRSLGTAAVLAAALEMAPLAWLPAWLTERCVLRPMRWAAEGTLEGARQALEHGLAVNLGGGFHHAKPRAGEGFCIYNDIAVCVAELRAEGRLAAEQSVLYVDLDAHQGNGVCYAFEDDPRVKIFDMYNGSLYPSQDARAQQRIDANLPLPHGCSGGNYLGQLRERLPDFLAEHAAEAGLAIYNAGTDVFCEDQLGGMRLSADEVFARDRYVLEQLRARQLPSLMLLSGGYSRQSYQLIARSVAFLLQAGL